MRLRVLGRMGSVLAQFAENQTTRVTVGVVAETSIQNSPCTRVKD